LNILEHFTDAHEQLSRCFEESKSTRDRPGFSETATDADEIDVDKNERESSSYDERLTIRGDALYGAEGPPSQDKFSLACPLCGDLQLGRDEPDLAKNLLRHLSRVHHQKVRKRTSREPLLKT